MDNTNEIIIAGTLQLETIINLKNEVFINQLGGDLPYCLAAYKLWCNGGRLISRIGTNFPQSDLVQLRNWGFNITGIIKVEQDVDQRVFYSVIEPERVDTENPNKYFAKIRMPLPKVLLGYQDIKTQIDHRTQPTALTIRSEEIPEAFMNASWIYLGPLDFISHRILIPLIRESMTGRIIIKPSSGTLTPAFRYDFPNLIHGCSVMITTRKRINNFFEGRISDPWEMARTITDYGVEAVVITCGKDGQLLFEKTDQKKYHIPAYPVDVIDPIHASDAFAGGFLAGIKNDFNNLKSTIYGNVAASIKLQGTTPDFLLHTLPELINARMAVVEDMVVCS
jgi:hypothetical protein